ncbi:MAG: ImmA/IrrE family metallo-endopeptidase [Sphingomonadales bacterium]|nr:ImmA/IrrE family metallo-endopeptidase [Sphingomonadales bacterium]
MAVRGLTVFANPLPVIVFGAEAPTAQAFTMAHELGHIIPSRAQ